MFEQSFYISFLRCGKQYYSWPSVSFDKAQQTLTNMAARIVLSSKQYAEIWINAPDGQNVLSDHISVTKAKSIEKVKL